MILITNDIIFCNYTVDFLEDSWIWLNKPNIKKLTNTPDFDKKSQIKWFNSLATKKNYYIKGIICENKRIGVVGLKNITKKDGEFWGYIGEEKYWGKGIGKKMLQHVINYSFFLNLEKIYTIVVKDNYRARQFYEKFGFIYTPNKHKDNLLYMEYLLNNK